MQLTEEAWKEQLHHISTNVSDYRVAMVQAEKNPGEQHLHLLIARLKLGEIDTLLHALLVSNPQPVSREQVDQQDFTEWIEGYIILSTDVRACESSLGLAYLCGNDGNRKAFLRATYTTLAAMRFCILRLIELQETNTVFSQKE